VLPLSFDYGLSQLTTAFLVGATAVLINHLFARDILKAVAERITGLAAVPPLWIQLAQLPWPADCTLRYLTNSGGAMPRRRSTRCARAAERRTLPDVRPDRSLPLDLPAAGTSWTAAPIRWARRSRTPR
jgi:acyl-CoA synthetase (AMP-forming)/AMP-acid ligase II